MTRLGLRAAGSGRGRLAARTACTLAGLLLAPADAADASYTVGAGGWVSERFGEGVAILRAPVTAPSRTGLLLLSCEGGEHRLRLSLPEPLALPRPDTVRSGTILVRGVPAPGRVVASVVVTGDRILTRAETVRPPGGAVTALADLLRTRPARLDLLFRPDGVPRLPARAVPIVLTMIWRAGDTLAIDDFSKACAR